MTGGDSGVAVAARRANDPMDHALSPVRRQAVLAVAATVLVVTVLAAIGAVVLRIVDPAPVVPSSFGFTDLSLVGFGFLGVTFSSVGALLAVRLPRNAVGWCMLVIGIAYALSALAAAVVFSSVARGPSGALGAAVAAWFAVLFSTIGGLVVALGFIFPTGRGHSPAWDRGIRVAALLAPLVIGVTFVFRPGPLQVFPTIDNPFGFGPDIRPLFGPQPSGPIAGLSTLMVPLLAWSLVARYRQSDEVGRQQLKWYMVSFVVAIFGIVVAAIAAVLTDRPPEAGLALFGFAGALVPIAIAIAILRYHLYEIDRIISRTVGWILVTGALAAVFVIVIVGLQAMLSPLTESNTLAVAASTLVTVALFQPLRSRIQRLVDRRFNRSHVYAERALVSFGEQVRDEVDLAHLRRAVVLSADEAVRPAGVDLWLRARVGADR